MKRKPYNTDDSSLDVLNEPAVAYAYTINTTHTPFLKTTDTVSLEDDNHIVAQYL